MENDNKKENEQKQKKKHSKLCSTINNLKFNICKYFY